MSNIKNQAKQMLNPPRLLSDTRYVNIWANIVRHVRSNDRKGLPRYGVLTLIARRTPFYLYDHPEVIKLCDTAFTEGLCVYMSIPLFNRLLGEDRVSNNATQSLVPVLLHELKHKALVHPFRMAALKTENEKEIMNIAADIFINMRLWRGFEDTFKLGATFLGNPATKQEPAWGCTQGEVERYWDLTEEQIFRLIRQSAKKMSQAYEKGWEAGKGGQPIPGLDKAQSGQAADPDQHPRMDTGKALQQGYQDGKEGNPCATRKMNAPDHLLSPGDLRKELEKQGMKDIADKLGLPQPGDAQALEQLAKTEQQRTQEDLAKAKQIRQQGGKMAGPHIEDAMATAIDDLYEPKLNWRVGMRELILGEGQQLQYSDEIPDAIYYQDVNMIGVEQPIYDGMLLPTENKTHVLVIIDTSGSVDDQMLKAFFSEAFGIVREDPMNAPQIMVFSADTALRGKPINVTPDNWEDKLEGLKAYGRGGTTFVEPLVNALKLAREQQRRVAGVVYFTDTYARPPARSELPELLPPIVFVAQETNSQVEHFRNDVSDYADVYSIDDTGSQETTIELDPAVTGR